MRAALFEETGKPFTITEVPDPEPTPSELVLRVRGAGICGSDLHMSDSGMPGGFVMGHEFSGEVVEVGREAVGDWQVGDRVCALPATGCGSCEACVTGNVMHCRGLSTVGLGQRPGAYAEYVVAGSRETFRLPESVDFGVGALVEPLAVGLHVVEGARLSPGDDVLIIGAGPVGVAVALWARHFGARNVVASDFVASRRELCARHGANAVIDPGAEEVLPAFERVTGRAPGVIIECVGVPGMIQQAMTLAPPQSRVVIAGVCMGQDQIVPVLGIMKELSVQFVSFYRKQDYALTLDMLAAERLKAGTLITDRIDLDALPAAFEALKQPTTQCKVVVEP